jgi:hypothetical protein
MILKFKGKDFHNKYITDNNVAKIKSLSYVCKKIDI